MREKLRPTSAALLALAALLAMCFPLRAATGPSYQVKPVYPDNQRSQSGYFDLRVQPGQEQDLTLLVINSDSTAIEVEVEVTDAATAPDGFIDYATAGVRDTSLKTAFTDLATVPEPVVTVPAGGSAEVTVSYRAPEEPFEGMVLGGIRVLLLSDAPSDAMIVNEYQYALAVALTGSDQPVEPDFALVGVETGLENYRAAVTATVRNPVPHAVKHAKVLAQLRQAGGAEPVFSLEKTVDMAPCSLWELAMVDQAGYGFQAGSYDYSLRIEYDGEVWEFEQPLEISGSQAQAMNNNAVNQQQQAAAGLPLWAMLLIGAGVLLLLLLIIVIILLLRKNRKQR